MTFSTLCLSFLPLLCQQDPGTRRLDVIELKNGDQLEGRVTTQLDGYVEIELQAGATIGLSSAQIASIKRGAGIVSGTSAGPMTPRSEWFVLYDGRGDAVGWLQAGVAVAADGSVTIGEEYEFRQGHRRYQVTSLCKADSSFAPQSCYFRERISEPVLGVSFVPGQSQGQAERVVDERIIEGTCQGTSLHVQQLDQSGRRERELPWSAQHTFPLLARAVARHSGAALAATTMFDPANDEVVVRTIDAARARRITWNGEPLQITEFAESSASGRNSVWLDATAKTLRRELAGPALVAVRSEAESARRLAGGVSIPSSFVVEAGGSFACWRPNPCWSVVDEVPEGRLLLTGPLPGSSIMVTRLDHLEAGALLSTAADAVANWFLLLHPELRFESRGSSQIKGRHAIRLCAASRLTRATVDVVEHGASFVVLTCLANRQEWDELQPDFEFVARSLELDAQAIEPTLQGPVKAQEAGIKRPTVRSTELPNVAPAAPAQTPPAPPRKLPLVRVPDDG